MARWFLPAFGSGIFLVGCSVGPDYVRPSTTAPAAYKSMQEMGTWKQGAPLDTAPKGNWWLIFNDPTLNSLEDSALKANQDLKAAMARVEEARAVARVARSELLPNISLDPSLNRTRHSANQVPPVDTLTANTISVPLDLSYEIDLWGRVRRSFESARAEAQASLAAYHSILLTLQADVAQNYFGLRALDVELATLTSTVNLRGEQLRLVRSRFEGGIGSNLDVARAETELATTEAEAAGLERQRGQMENSLGILAGVNPSQFKIEPLTGANWNPEPPIIPAGLPAELLERRPDVAEAERQLAAANARIGVAKAAFFPVVRLTGSGGYLSGDVDNLFNWESRVWSIGPSVSLPVFAGGRNRANLERSRAAFEEAVARYRQQILVAFGDIESSLLAIACLSKQAAAQSRAVASSRKAADLASDRYRSGIVSYLEVVDANRERLQAERAQAQLTGERLVVSVQLVKALGGGWTESELLANRGSIDSKK